MRAGPRALARSAFAGDPADDGLDIGFGEGRARIDPVENIEGAGAGVVWIERHDAVTHALASPVDHRPNLTRGIEHDGGAGPGQHRRHADRSGLEAAGARDDEGMRRPRAAGIDQQRRAAALSPGTLVRRIEGARRHAVLVDAVSLADDDTAKFRVRSREKLFGFFHRQPIGMAVIVGRGAGQSLGRLAQHVAAQQADADRQGETAKAEGGDDAGIDGADHREGGDARGNMLQRYLPGVGREALDFRPDGQTRGDDDADAAGIGHDAPGELHSVGDERRDHDRDRAGEGDGGPGAIGEDVARIAAPMKRQQPVAPGDVGAAPGEPEQPQRPERNDESQTRAGEIVAYASDHETVAASLLWSILASLFPERPAIIDGGGTGGVGGEGCGAGAAAGAETRRTDPPCSLASVKTSS